MNAAKYYHQKIFASLFVATETSLLLWFLNAWQSVGPASTSKEEFKADASLDQNCRAGRLTGLFSCTFYSIMSLSHLCSVCRSHCLWIALPRYKWILETHWWKELRSFPIAIALFPLGVCPGLCMTLFHHYLGVQLQMRSNSVQFHDAGSARKHVSMATPGLPHPTAFRCYWPQKQFFFPKCRASISYVYRAQRGLLVCFDILSICSELGQTLYVWGAFCM